MSVLDRDIIPLFDLDSREGASSCEKLIDELKLDVRSLIAGPLAAREAEVRQIMRHVLERGADALVEIARRFDDPNFTHDRLTVTREEMKSAHDDIARTNPKAIEALQRSIAQVREYQTRLLPQTQAQFERGGLKLGWRYTAIDRVGLYVPGGKASYPSSLIMLAVPAQVANVRQIVVTTPAGAHGENALLLAAAHELSIESMYRIGGPAAIMAMASGIDPIGRPVDQICGPGNDYVQLAKRLVSGAVGVDGFYGPSEIVVLADASADASCVAADLLAQAEHNPGRCFLLCDDIAVVDRIMTQISTQLATAGRHDAIARALRDKSAVIVARDWAKLLAMSDRLAAEHVSIQTRDPRGTLAQIRHAGAAFLGRYSPVAAGDYVAGPSHTLPTNTTARFGGGVSVFNFLKRSSVVEYDQAALRLDAQAIQTMATLEGLDAHGKSVAIRE